MWLSSRYGFCSVVEARPENGGKGHFEIRTRNEEDARSIGHLLGLEPISTPKGDYAWRLIADRTQLKTLMLAAADTVDYRNYKKTMTGRRAAAHHDAWWSFLKLKDGPQLRQKWFSGGNTGTSASTAAHSKIQQQELFDWDELDESPWPGDGLEIESRSLLRSAEKRDYPAIPGTLERWDPEQKRWVKEPTPGGEQ